MTTAAARDGRQTRWDDHKSERRRQILAAAIEVVQEAEPGTEVHVQEIAARAGLSRTVVYRHFADRADLDRAVQAEILDQVWDLLLPQLTLDGTVPQIITRVIGTYVDWAVTHPSLHRLADHDTAAQNGPLALGLERLAEQIAGLFLAVVPAWETEGAPPGMAALVDPLVHGVVGAAFSAVRRWISRPDRELDAAQVTDLVSESIWFVIQGHAATFQIPLTRQTRVEEVVGALVASR